MDPLLLLVSALAAGILSFAAILWHRKRQAQQAGSRLQQAAGELSRLESTLQPFLGVGDYIPERIRRPLEGQVAKVTEQILPPIAKVVRRSRDRQMRDRFGSAMRRASTLLQVLKEHNDSHAKRLIAEHSKLLVEELQADEAQRMAIVRDDERNLVIAGAGSGKTRTIVGRIRFLLERDFPPFGILAVTFTNKATEEMQGRLKKMGVEIADRSGPGVTVSTLHALGKRVVQGSTNGPISVADDRWTDSLVAAVLRDARTGLDPKLARLYTEAILHFHRNEDERAPAVDGDKTYRTLRGEHVRSIGERIIADFLFVHNVNYRYEAKASWADVGAARRAYHPDFTLPGIDACIEYWGVSRAGEVPGWMGSSAEYQQGMAWKRDQFRRAGKRLIEFYEYERLEGALDDRLRERLTAAGVALQVMTFDQLENSFSDMKYIGSSIEKLLVQFIANARELRREPAEIQQRLDRATPRVRHFGLLGLAALERYETALEAEGRIDFSDMLHRAADLLEGGANPLPRFEHILVDEFQDTSAAMARFLKALVEVNHARLFAVGDDWQAIYGFAGGDVDHIVNFESYFGLASTTMLNVNYRSPAVIVEAGGALIAHNETQVPKQVVVFRPDRGEAYVHEAPDDDAEIVNRTVRLLGEELESRAPDEILVLSRTNHLLDTLAEACRRHDIRVANPERNELGVRLLSAHKAKGLEANVVIVVNASDHIFGFPSKVESPDVLEPVRKSTGDDQAEERRLFYVAITRAMQRLHLIARQGLPSPYLAEIEGVSNPSKRKDSAYVPVGARLADTFYVERLYPLSERQAQAGIRQSGLLATANSRFAFTSWAPISLEAGATYRLKDVLRERPYRGQQRIKLDDRTSAERRLSAQQAAQAGNGRELRPRPPPSHQPRLGSR
jgi:DNA helicase-4